MTARRFRTVGLLLLVAWTGAVGFAYHQQHPLPVAGWRYAVIHADWLSLVPTVDALLGGAGHVLAAASILLAAASIGLWIVPLVWRPRMAFEAATTPGERFWLATACGISVVVLATVGLAAAGLLYAPLLWTLVAVPLFLGAPRLAVVWRAARGKDPTRDGGMLVRMFCRVVGALIVLAVLPVALSPHVLHDSLVYHLGLPRAYLDAHGFVSFPHVMFANTPLNTEMLYTLALTLGGAPTAKLVHLACGLGMLSLTAALGRRVLDGPTGVAAAFLTLGTPLVVGQLPTSYVDLAAGFVFMATLWCIVRWAVSGESGPLGPAALTLGLFAGMRYTAVFGVVAVAAGVLVVLARRRASVWQWLGAATIFAAGLAVGAGPWLLKNVVHVGNPVFPVATGMFGLGPLSATELARTNVLVAQHGMGHGPLDLLLLPWRVTVNGNPGYATFDGILSPLWLVALPAVVTWRRMPPACRVLGVVALAYWLAWTFSTHIARYLIPIFPVFSLLALGGLVRLLPEWAGPRVRGACLFTIVLAAGVWWVPAVVPTALSVLVHGPVAAGRESVEDYLARTDQTAAMYAYMARELPEDARVVGLWENRTFRAPRPLEGDAVYEAPRWLDRFATDDPRALARTFRMDGFTHLLLNTRHLQRYPPRPSSEADAELIARALRGLKTFTTEYCAERYAANDLYLYEIRDTTRPADT